MFNQGCDVSLPLNLLPSLDYDFSPDNPLIPPNFPNTITNTFGMLQCTGTRYTGKVSIGYVLPAKSLSPLRVSSPRPPLQCPSKTRTCSLPLTNQGEPSPISVRGSDLATVDIAEEMKAP